MDRAKESLAQRLRQRGSIGKIRSSNSALQVSIFTALALWDRVRDVVKTLLDLLVPKVVYVEIALEKQLSDAIAQAIHDRVFRTELLAHPKQTLSSLDITLPSQQEVTVLESTATQTFLVLPIMTDREVEHLQAGLSSHRSLRSLRSRILLKTWQEPDYKARLCADPKAVLCEEGLELPALATVKILENTLEHLYLVLPSVY